ncbi:bifunctional diguanylate cyclase/phosphodiesterase [Pseudacidovorax sp. RU35E]|uniref:putative bifunctional diguanylate cyclase/phosphodiesterase n=1 Tax=Pseudacidovorax sp. RU35E TaxID=1907403 RepID=UPI000954A284|nr:EAL domain-containing protein [Pseudacidovorax sp. RU35E]SIR39593.1 diguanylate cyclase/phosphodiesterase [Pseudacidovorax sp. RU35E]
MIRAFYRASLVNRIAMVMLVLLLFIQAGTFWAARQSLWQQARTDVQQRLMVGEGIWRNLLAQRQQRLHEAASVLASDYGFREALAAGDADTLASALGNGIARIGASTAASLDAQFRWLAESPGDVSLRLSAAQLRLLAAHPATDGAQLYASRGKVYQLVLVPIRAPLVVGWVLMSFELTADVAHDFTELAQLQLMLLASDGPGPLRPLIDSLPEGEPPPVGRLKDEDLLEWRRGGQDWLLRRAPQSMLDGRMEAVLAASLAPATGATRGMAFQLGLISVLGLLLFAISGRIAVRQAVQPLAELSASTRAIGAGNFDVPIHQREREDEVGMLARDFDDMRVNLRAHRSEVTRLAFHDSLTSLPNREAFKRTLARALARAGAAADREPEGHHEEADDEMQAPPSLVVLLLDIHRFKLVNDVLGFAFGDGVLQAVAARLDARVQLAGDGVARIGSNTFAAVRTGLDRDEAEVWAQSLVRLFDEQLLVAGQRIDVQVSAGYACWPEDAATGDELVGRAEAALQAAKRQGREWLAYEPAQSVSTAVAVSLLSELRGAVTRNELRLFLQPKLSLDSGQVCTAEALLRWQHPERGLLPPVHFIPFAEQTGFVRRLTQWVFDEACRCWLTLSAQGLEMVSVNLSTRDLVDTQLIGRLQASLDRHRVPASAFCLEITESAIMDDPQRARATLVRLGDMGFRLSIDDFGTGYSSLAYLKHLPVHQLKVDKSFVLKMADDQSDANIVRAIVDLAHNLALEVVAEGVESPEALDALVHMGCEKAQGFHIARPMPWEAFGGWIAARAAEQAVARAAAQGTAVQGTTPQGTAPA